jgi:L,D-transpeptidase catalytic domain
MKGCGVVETPASGGTTRWGGDSLICPALWPVATGTRSAHGHSTLATRCTASTARISRQLIGSFVSSGCIRLTNEDISDLYKRVKVGTRVVVLSGKERPNVASPVTSPRAGSSAQRSALSADEKRKQPKEPEPQTPTGSTRGETTEAHNNALQTEVKSENAAFEE